MGAGVRINVGAQWEGGTGMGWAGELNKNKLGELTTTTRQCSQANKAPGNQGHTTGPRTKGLGMYVWAYKAQCSGMSALSSHNGQVLPARGYMGNLGLGITNRMPCSRKGER